MRYTKLLIVLSLLVMVVLPASALAQDGLKDVEEQEVIILEQRTPGDMHCLGMEISEGENGELMILAEPQMPPPMEPMWFDHPWDFQRHWGPGMVDFEAMHFMATIENVMVLPFADLTTPTHHGESILAESGGPRRIVDDLVCELQNHGYLVYPPSDAAYLMEAYFIGEMSNPETDEYYEQEVANNQLYFDVMPQRAMDFYMEVVPGLERHANALDGEMFLTKDDILELASLTDSQAIIRGYVHEYAVTTDIDADWRTLVPPFLGLINPDKRVTIMISYYLYDGATGNMIWNTTVEMQDDTNWPLFESTTELIDFAEHDAVWNMTGRILPDWTQLVWGHPDWMPRHGWHDMYNDDVWYNYERPGWLNPYRHGWHDVYHRHDWRIDMPCFGGDYEGHPPVTRYNNIMQRYNGMLEGHPSDRR